MKALHVVLAAVVAAVGAGSARGADEVTAGGLIEEVRHSQDWLGRVRSFNVTFKVEELAAPGTPPAANRIQSEQIAFDDHRFYRGEEGTAGHTFAWWDGKVAWQSSNRGYLRVSDSKAYFVPGIIWGRNGQQFWFTDSHNPHDDFVGASSLYVREKDETFRGTECFVLADAANRRKVYVGIADHRFYGIDFAGTTFTLADYKEVAKGDWYPMTQGELNHESFPPGERAEGIIYHVTDIAFDKPLPDKLFEQTLRNGTHVDETLGGKRRQYVFQGDRSAAELAEIAADEARQRAYGPPAILPGQGVVLGSRAEPLPVSPLAGKLAPDFPAEAKWIGTPMKLAGQRGKVVIVLFWATWQDFYADGLMAMAMDPPALTLPAEIAKETVLVGVHVPTTDVARVEKAVKENNWTFPVCVDVAGKNGWGEMADGYHVDELPVFYVIDQEGKAAALGSWAEAVRRAGELLGKSGVKPKD